MLPWAKKFLLQPLAIEQSMTKRPGCVIDAARQIIDLWRSMPKRGQQADDPALASSGRAAAVQLAAGLGPD